jgi:hypothetical protein
MPRKNQKVSFRRNLINLSAVLAIFFVITACYCKNDDPEGNTAPANQTQANKSDPSRTAAVTSDSANKKEDKGDFQVEHVPVKNARYNEIDRQIKEEKLLERAADKLNRNLMLPYDITLQTKDCGEINAYYDPQDKTVMVCYELMEHYYRIFKSTGMNDQAAYNKMFDAIRFAFLHELGHALIDAYKLPVIGNEEDAADRCSSYICLTELGDEGVRSVLAAADGFSIESKNSSPSSRNMADEHLLQEQRFYNTLCMIYGSDTNKYTYIVRDNYLPRERAARCPSEFERTVQSWSNLFEPWRKQ